MSKRGARFDSPHMSFYFTSNAGFLFRVCTLMSGSTGFSRIGTAITSGTTPARSAGRRSRLGTIRSKNILSIAKTVMSERSTKVSVFGVFDKLHPGHAHFLDAARALGDELVVIVARDATVEQLKKKIPNDSERDRIAALERVKAVSRARLGDEMLGTYAVLKEENPDVIALGYDQIGLRDDLEKRIASGFLPEIPIVLLNAHRPEIYKTSFMN